MVNAPGIYRALPETIVQRDNRTPGGFFRRLSLHLGQVKLDSEDGGFAQ